MCGLWRVTRAYFCFQGCTQLEEREYFPFSMPMVSNRLSLWRSTSSLLLSGSTRNRCGRLLVRPHSTHQEKSITKFRMQHKEHLGNSRMGKGMVFPLWTFLIWSDSLLLKGILTFSHTQEGIVPRGNVVNPPLCRQFLGVTIGLWCH